VLYGAPAPTYSLAKFLGLSGLSSLIALKVSKYY